MDEALDFFYQELERIQKTYGPSALLTASGWQSTGMFHNASGMLARAIALHGNSVSTGGDYSTGAAQVILPRVVGSMEVYEQQTSWPLVLENSKTIVLWGSDLIKNQQANWWCPDHDVYEYYEQLKDKVARGEISVISVDPVVTSTHDYLGRDKVKHIAVNPQADVPLQLALAHTLYTEKLYDKHFLDNYCVGLSNFCLICWAKVTDSLKMPSGRKKSAELMQIRFVNWRGRWRAAERKLLPAGASSVCSMGNSGRG